jgi:hypothetical protein
LLNREKKSKSVKVSCLDFLGVTRFSCVADKVLILLKKKLGRFYLTLEHDIVSVVTDGASVMVKVGKLIHPLQQLCFAHGIQLAVVSIMYSKNDQTINATEIDRNEQDNFDNDDDDHDEYDYVDGGLELIEEDDEEVSFDLTNNDNINVLVNQVNLSLSTSGHYMGVRPLC